MPKTTVVMTCAWVLLGALARADTPFVSEPTAEYTAEGLLKRPQNYRDGIFLTSGFDMSYSASARPNAHVFDNVFVNRSAYETFKTSGVWPDKTVLVIEIRGAAEKGSINKSGHYQGPRVVAIEAHIKDKARFSGQWAFFEFTDGQSAPMIPRSAACYSCHAEHAAVDTTFVQFYPSLLPIAQRQGTLSESYTSDRVH
jgi:Cytochrome P460